MNNPIVVEKTFNSPIKKVWNAITNKNEMKQWYFDLPAFNPTVGTEFEFWGGTDDKQYLHLCKVTEAVNEKKIAYSWRYDGYDGNSIVAFEIFPVGEKTKLVLTHSGIETFPSDNPDLVRENFVEGWNHIINISLEEYLSKDH